MKKYLMIIVLLLVATLMANSSGEYGFQMLKINGSAGVAAQAGSGAFSTDDANVFAQNAAAGIAFSGRTISIVKNFWLFDTSMTAISYLNSTGRSSFGISFRSLDYGKFDRRDEVGTEILGEFHTLDLGVTLNYARKINANHSFGINIGGLYEKIDTSSSLALAFDLGYRYRTPIRDLDINASLKNIGLSSKMDKEKIKLPFAGELGFVKKIYIRQQIFNSEIKVIKNAGDDNFKSTIGLNTMIKKVFTLRLGYKFNYDSEFLTAGFGINIKRISFDYTYLPFKDDLNSVSMIGFSYKM